MMDEVTVTLPMDAVKIIVKNSSILEKLLLSESFIGDCLEKRKLFERVSLVTGLVFSARPCPIL